MNKALLTLLLLFSYSINWSQKKDYSQINNIPYYNESKIKSDTYIKERAVLDLYYPKNTKDFPTLIWFHGGGLTGGNKEILEGFKEKGFAIIAVNYRLSPKVKVENCIEDAAAAVAWTFKNIANYGGNNRLLFVSGHSAGGYLSMMIGLEKKWLQAHQIDANAIASILPLSGQTITHFENRKERGIPETQPLIDSFAPLYHVRADAPPLVLITGDRELELLGRYEENAYMMRMMKIKGHSATTLYELDGYDHGMIAPAIPLVIKEIHKRTALIKQTQ